MRPPFKKPSVLSPFVPVFLARHTSGIFLPLSAGMLRAYAQHYKGGELSRHYRFFPIAQGDIETSFKMGRAFGPGIWLFSDYCWNIDDHLNLSARLKWIDPANITIHGGPQAPGYPQALARFMADNPHVDIVVHGEGEITAAELLEKLAENRGAPGRRFDGLDRVAGLSYRDDDGRLVHTPPRPRLRDLDRLASPYLDGVFDFKPAQARYAILETNRGCPYGCTYCDWGQATASKLARFELERVKAEIDWMAQHRVEAVYIADANFGILERDVEIAEHFLACKERWGFPNNINANYAKNAPERNQAIYRIFRRGGFSAQHVLAIQTLDPATLNNVGRGNIATGKLMAGAEESLAEGMPVVAELIHGLPGATLESFLSDFQFCIDRDILAWSYRPELLPNSPMADPAYRERYRLEVDARGRLLSTYSYGRDDARLFELIGRLYTLLEGLGLMRVLLRYMQWDLGIPATRFLLALARRLMEAPEACATVRRENDTLLIDVRAGGWRGFYDEMTAFAVEAFGVVVDTAFLAARQANEAIMPGKGLTLPLSLPLAHDVAVWFGANQGKTGGAKLASHGPAAFPVSDPHDLCRHLLAREHALGGYQLWWELDSPLTRVRTAPAFTDIPSSNAGRNVLLPEDWYETTPLGATLPRNRNTEE